MLTYANKQVLAAVALSVDFMHVRVYLHPYTHTRSSLGFHGWDTGMQLIQAIYYFEELISNNFQCTA
jgi:hypothetical protein